MCMKQHEIIIAAYGCLMALTFAGTYVLGDRSWMAYLLLVPAFMILKAIDAPRADTSGAEGRRRPTRSR